MALKGDRHVVVDDISFFMDQVAERGGVVCFKTSGSGAALDQAAAEVEYAADSSGAVPVGVLMNDMVNVDLTKYTLNPYKDEMQKGSKVTLVREGWVTTNMIPTGVSPSGSQDAYVADSGMITNSSAGGAPKCGEWLSKKDADGYAKLYVKLPQ